MTKVEVTYSYFPFSVRPLCTMVGFDKYHPEIIKFDFFDRDARISKVFFLITRTIFSHSRSQQFWKQNTICIEIGKCTSVFAIANFSRIIIDYIYI